MKSGLFYLGLGLFFTHELDAMSHHEWRVLPLTSWMSDALGEQVFLYAHIPLFALLVAGIASSEVKIRQRVRFWFSLFLVAHGLLHFVFTTHELYDFHTIQSQVLIFGAAACGACYLLFNYRARFLRT